MKQPNEGPSLLLVQLYCISGSWVTKSPACAIVLHLRYTGEKVLDTKVEKLLEASLAACPMRGLP